jgi:hypothetical protein
MFLHTKILLENKFNNVMKLVKKTGMSKYWFMENHFIPTLLNKNSLDLTSFITNLEKSFSKLVEAIMPTSNFASLHKEMGGGEEAEKEAITAVRDFVFGKEGNLDNVIQNINIPELTSGKTALVKKLVSDLSKFLSNYKFEHPDTPDKAFIDKKTEKETVNRILGRRIAAILGNAGNVYDDLVAFDVEKIKSYYAGIDAMANGNFTPEQIDMLNKNNFDPTSIQNLADKIRNIIVGKVSRTGSKEETEQILLPRKESYTKEQKILMKALSIDDVVKVIKVVDKDSEQEYNAQNVEGLKNSIKNREVPKIEVTTKLKAAKEFLLTKVNRPRLAYQIDNLLDQIPNITMIKLQPNRRNPQEVAPKEKTSVVGPNIKKPSKFRQGLNDLLNPTRPSEREYISQEDAAKLLNINDEESFLDLAASENIEGTFDEKGKVVFKKSDIKKLQDIIKNLAGNPTAVKQPQPPSKKKPIGIDDVVDEFQ